MKQIILDKIDSTNEYAKRIVKDVDENVLIIANSQTNGRGTHGRNWYSEEGQNILMSFLIKDIKDYKRIDGITLEIGKIIHEILSSKFDLNFEIKLPNDILCNGKKICGILCESSITNNKINYLIIGIGLNVNQTDFNEEIKDIATSLKNELEYDIDKKWLIERINNKIEDVLINSIIYNQVDKNSKIC